MHIKLSGPQAQRKRATQALEDAGFTVLRDQFDDAIPESYGMDDEVKAGSWLTVEGDDINKANSAVESLGWRLRAHHDAPTPKPTLSLPERLNLLGIDPSELATVLAEVAR